MQRAPRATGRNERERALRRLKWSAVLLPALFIWVSETLRHHYFDEGNPWLGNLATASVALAGSFAFAQLFFRVIARIDARLVTRNHRLATLHMLTSLATEPGDEASLLAASLPVIRDALRAAVARVAPLPEEGSGGVVQNALAHDGASLGVLVVEGAQQPIDATLLAAVGDTLAVGLANRRLAAQNARLAMLEERDRIARELHDGLAQMLAAITLHSEHARAALANGNAAAARVALDRIEHASGAAYVDVREAIVGLRAGTAGDFRAALQQTAEWFDDITDIAVTVSAPPEDRLPLPPLAELQLLRIVQEALTNVRKHARAAHVAVTMTHDPVAGVRLTIRDDGIGFDPDHVPRAGRQHFGLLIMRERAESLGGTLVVTAAPGRGTIVAVALPALAAAARGAA